MRFLKNNVIFRLYNSYVVDSPQPANISYVWNFGSLLAVCLGLQILTGCFLAMHYVANIDLAFNSVEHIMRDVENGWLIRYIHANVASFFFIFVYAHVGRNIYYGSFKSPRVLVWSIGVIILILMMAIAFLGYVLPYGQMSLWGITNHASNVNFLINYIFTFLECLGKSFYDIYNLLINEIIILFEYLINKLCLRHGSEFYLFEELKSYQLSVPLMINKISRLRADKRIGPHNKIVLDIIIGSLLGDGHAEYRKIGKGTRITFYQEGIHTSYLLWLHSLFSELGYCNLNVPKIQTRLGSKGIVRKIIRFRTWTFSSFNWIHDLWYINGIKVIPSNIGEFLTPLALAIWIMDDGGKVNQGLKLSTNSYTYSECLFLVKILYDNFNLQASVQSAGVSDQYQIYIWKESMPLLREIVLPYVHSSMKYKLI